MGLYLRKLQPQQPRNRPVWLEFYLYQIEQILVMIGLSIRRRNVQMLRQFWEPEWIRRTEQQS